MPELAIPMYRPRDITDSIATAAIIILVGVTLAIGLITVMGFRMPDIESTAENVNASMLDPILDTPLGFIDIGSMDPASKIIFGSLFGLMLFLIITLIWVYWYRYKGRNK